jgi:biofilm protein TabA
MILDTLSAAMQYEGLGPGIALGLAYVRDFDPETADGRHPLSGDDLFALVQSYETGPATDIQYVAEGTERILYAPVEGLRVSTPYSEAGDVLFFEEPGVSSSLLLRPGEFAIFFPGDAHKPGCMAGGRERVKKVVIKVRV